MVKKTDTYRSNSIRSTLISKFIENDSNPNTYDQKGGKQQQDIVPNFIQNISDEVQDLVSDIEVMFQILPDIEMAATIKVAAILSPKDLSVPEIIYDSSYKDMKEEHKNRFNKYLKSYFDNEFELKSKLPDIVKKALFTKGAYISLIVPESSLDHLINNKDISVESLDYLPEFANIGLFDSKSVTVESEGRVYKSSNDFLIFHDNPAILRLPAIKESGANSKLNTLYSKYSMESLLEERVKTDKVREKVKIDTKKDTDMAIRDKLENSRTYLSENILRIKEPQETDRDSVGHPTVINLPVESTAPIFVKGDPSKRLGYYILLDENYSPVSIDNNVNVLSDIRRRNRKGSNELTNTVSLVGSAFGLDSKKFRVDSFDELQETFVQVFEDSLINKMRKAVNLKENDIDISTVSAFNQIVLSRLCRKKQTRVLYAPTSLVNYIAFDYGKQGIGKSALEDTRIIGSIRVILTIGEVLNQVRNNMDHSVLDMQFDPKDPDPLQIAAIAKDAFLKTRSTSNLKLGYLNPETHLDWFNRAGVKVVYGNHPDLPNFKVDVKSESPQRVIPDANLSEKMQDLHLRSLAMPPDLVKSGKDIQLATQVINSNFILSKDILIKQTILEPQLAELIYKYASNSQIIVDDLKEILTGVEENEKNKIIKKYFDKFTIGLPKPDSSTLKSQMEAFEEYSRSVEEIIKTAIVSEDFISDSIEGDISREIRTFAASFKALLLRKYMFENNILPETLDVVSKDNSGSFILDFTKNHGDYVNTITEIFKDYITQARGEAKKRDKELEESTQDQETQDQNEGGNDSDIYDMDASSGSGGGEQASYTDMDGMDGLWQDEPSDNEGQTPKSDGDDNTDVEENREQPQETENNKDENSQSEDLQETEDNEITNMDYGEEETPEEDEKDDEEITDMDYNEEEAPKEEEDKEQEPKEEPPEEDKNEEEDLPEEIEDENQDEDDKKEEDDLPDEIDEEDSKKKDKTPKKEEEELPDELEDEEENTKDKKKPRKDNKSRNDDLPDEIEEDI